MDRVSTPGVPRRAEDLDDHAFTCVDVRGKTDHFDHDFVAFHGVLGARIADRDRLGNHVPVDLDERLTGAFLVHAHELAGLAFDDLDDRPAELRLAAAGRLEADLNHIAGGGIAGLAQRDEDISLASGGRGRADGRTKP